MKKLILILGLFISLSAIGQEPVFEETSSDTLTITKEYFLKNYTKNYMGESILLKYATRTQTLSNGDVLSTDVVKQEINFTRNDTIIRVDWDSDTTYTILQELPLENYYVNPTDARMIQLLKGHLRGWIFK